MNTYKVRVERYLSDDKAIAEEMHKGVPFPENLRLQYLAEVTTAVENAGEGRELIPVSVEVVEADPEKDEYHLRSTYHTSLDKDAFVRALQGVYYNRFVVSGFFELEEAK